METGVRITLLLASAPPWRGGAKISDLIYGPDLLPPSTPRVCLIIIFFFRERDMKKVAKVVGRRNGQSFPPL